jgi:hypothetical protein
MNKKIVNILWWNYADVCVCVLHTDGGTVTWKLAVNGMLRCLTKSTYPDVAGVEDYGVLLPVEMVLLYTLVLLPE